MDFHQISIQDIGASLDRSLQDATRYLELDDVSPKSTPLQKLAVRKDDDPSPLRFGSPSPSLSPAPPMDITTGHEENLQQRNSALCDQITLLQAQLLNLREASRRKQTGLKIQMQTDVILLKREMCGQMDEIARLKETASAPKRGMFSMPHFSTQIEIERLKETVNNSKRETVSMSQSSTQTEIEISNDTVSAPKRETAHFSTQTEIIPIPSRHEVCTNTDFPQEHHHYDFVQSASDQISCLLHSVESYATSFTQTHAGFSMELVTQSQSINKAETKLWKDRYARMTFENDATVCHLQMEQRLLTKQFDEAKSSHADSRMQLSQLKECLSSALRLTTDYGLRSAYFQRWEVGVMRKHKENSRVLGEKVEEHEREISRLQINHELTLHHLQNSFQLLTLAKPSEPDDQQVWSARFEKRVRQMQEVCVQRLMWSCERAMQLIFFMKWCQNGRTLPQQRRLFQIIKQAKTLLIKFLAERIETGLLANYYRMWMHISHLSPEALMREIKLLEKALLQREKTCTKTLSMLEESESREETLRTELGAVSARVVILERDNARLKDITQLF